MHADTVTHNDQVLAAALLTLAFDDHSDTAVILLTGEVTSLAVAGMIDGQGSGHAIALEQLYLPTPEGGHSQVKFGRFRHSSAMGAKPEGNFPVRGVGEDPARERHSIPRKA